MKAASKIDGQPARDRGFVLIAVAGVLLLLAIVSSSLQLASQTSLKARFARNAHAEAAAFADGMVRLTAHRLARQRIEVPVAGQVARQVLLDGTPAWCGDGGLLVEVGVFDTAGLIDLNHAPFDTLEVLFIGLGMAKPAAAGLAAAIVDFRDADDAPSIGGAEAGNYLQAGRSFGPKNGPFDSVDELDQVLGMTPEVMERVRPLVTVHSRAPGIDSNLAPLALLRILSRSDGGVETGEPSGNQLAQLALPAQVSRRVSSRRSRTRIPVMIVRAHVTGPNGAGFLREATIELSSQSASGFVIKAWTSLALTGVRAIQPAGPIEPCLN